MRTDAKVYVLQDGQGRVLSVNASLKNLLDQMKKTRAFSRSCPNKQETLKSLRSETKVSPHVKKNCDLCLITCNTLGDLSL